MPWCERCDRFLNPNTVATDGTCPSCGRTVERVERTDVLDREVPDDEERVRAPWHFWVMVAAVVIYLGWRAVQGVFWAAGNWF